MKKNLACSLVTLFILMLSGSAHAALEKIGTANFVGAGDHYNLIWDDDNNGNSVVWLDYTNSKTTWGNQNSWAAGLDSALTIHLNPGVSVEWSNNPWRLPNAAGGRGWGKIESEMGHLYYTELGNSASPYGDGLQNTGDFDNLNDSWYWSGTENAADPDFAWYFNLNNGFQDQDYKSINNIIFYGLAVRTGDVSLVPVPGTLLLLSSGLLGIASVSRRRKGIHC